MQGFRMKFSPVGRVSRRRNPTIPLFLLSFPQAVSGNPVSFSARTEEAKTLDPLLDWIPD